MPVDMIKTRFRIKGNEFDRSKIIKSVNKDLKKAYIVLIDPTVFSIPLLYH